MEERDLFIKENGLKQINEYGDYYVSNKGEVFSYKNGYKTRKGWLKLKPFMRNKYMYVQLVSSNKKRKFAVHRLVARYFVEGYEDGLVVNHIDGNPLNNNADNLEWVTQRVNVVKGYETSGIDQTRNYHYYKLKLPNGEICPCEFKGFKDFKEWFDKQEFEISALTLRVKKVFRGYELIKFDK